MNRENLAKLADYLHTLPDDYAKFDMATYIGRDSRHSATVDDTPELRQYLLNNDGLPDCGSVACAVGHGPAAHIFMLPDELTGGWGDGPQWSSYVERVFGFPPDSDEFRWLFSPEWARQDNTPQGAAKRIDYLLANGLPEGWDEYVWVHDFLDVYQ